MQQCRLARAQDVPGVFGRPTADHNGTVGSIAQREVEVEARSVLAAVEQLAVAAVWICGEGHVAGSDGLTRGDGLGEAVLGLVERVDDCGVGDATGLRS